MRLLDELKTKMFSGNFTCVISDGNFTRESTEKGIAPLLALIKCGRSFRGCSAADKIVGKAAALLYAYMGVVEVYAEVLGADALPVLRRYGVAVEFGTLTEHIINRKGDGICPMEAAVASIDDPCEAKEALEAEAERLTANGGKGNKR